MLQNGKPKSKYRKSLPQGQAHGYANIVKTLISKRNNGVVTFNTWGVYDKNEISDHEFKYIYDSNLNPKKAVDELKKALKDKSTTPNYLD